jgi:hypothetical protein
MDAILSLYGPQAAANQERLGEDQYQAQVLAMMVRNGIEDLHSQGAIDDELMPAFNRTVRSWLFTLRLADALRDTPAAADPLLVDFLDDLRQCSDPYDNTLRALYVAAASRAVDAFCVTHEIDLDWADQLSEAAERSLSKFFVSTRSDEGSSPLQTFIFAAGLIPEYWEPAEVLPHLAEALS